MTHDIESYRIDGQTLVEQATAAVQASLPTDQLGGWLSGAYEAVLAYLAEAGVSPAGPPYARFIFHDDLVDVEAGFPVTTRIPGHARIIASSLPGGPAAVTTHHGPYEHLTAAYDAVAAWLDEHGLRPAGPHWEVYYTDPRTEPDPARWRTDLIQPYQAG